MDTPVSEENQTTEVVVQDVPVKVELKSKAQLKNKEQVREFLIHSITKNKPDISNFLFEKSSEVLDEIFADNDSKLHQALIYASAKGYTEMVDLILARGQGLLKFESLEAAIEASSKEGHKNVKDLLFDKIVLDAKSFERLMYASIDKGDLDAVMRLFDKQK